MSWMRQASARMSDSSPAGRRDPRESRPRPGKTSNNKATMPPRRAWLWFVIAVIANYFLFRMLLPSPGAPLTVPYTVFKEQVAKGNVVADDVVMERPQVASWMIKRFEEVAVMGESPDEMFVPLSPREMEILKYITDGFSNKEIAKALGISRQTVKNHMTSIMRKLAVNDRTQAAVYALRRGWIRLQDTK